MVSRSLEYVPKILVPLACPHSSSPLEGEAGWGVIHFWDRFLIPVIALLTLIVALEQQAAAAEPAAAPEPGKMLESKTMFYRLLARKSVATVEDAIRAVARYKGSSQELQPLAVEMEFLEKQGVRLPKNVARTKDETLMIGAAAHMLMKAMKIKGGVMYTLFPDNQRYALREAIVLGIVKPNSFIGQTMSGNDLVGMLVLVKDVGEKQKAKYEVKKY